jgi:hypothetical protein
VWLMALTMSLVSNSRSKPRTFQFCLLKQHTSLLPSLCFLSSACCLPHLILFYLRPASTSDQQLLPLLLCSSSTGSATQIHHANSEDSGSLAGC